MLLLKYAACFKVFDMSYNGIVSLDEMFFWLPYNESLPGPYIFTGLILKVNGD